jgi:hypothetical protein
MCTVVKPGYCKRFKKGKRDLAGLYGPGDFPGLLGWAGRGFAISRIRRRKTLPISAKMKQCRKVS